MNVRTIGQIAKSGDKSITQPRKPKLVDQISEDIQMRIVEMTKDGMSRSQISKALINDGVPSPKMAVPWGQNAITLVQKKYSNMIGDISKKG